MITIDKTSQLLKLCKHQYSIDDPLQKTVKDKNNYYIFTGMNNG